MSTAQGVDKSIYFVSTSLRPTNKFVCEQCKNKKMSIKSTSPCFVCFFAEREGLATTQASLLRLTPFPCLAGRLLAKMGTAQGVDKSIYFVSTSLRPTNKFVCEQCKNKKMSIKSTSPCFVCFFAEREGFEPPVQLPVHRISSAARSTTPAPFLVRFAVQMYEFIL